MRIGTRIVMIILPFILCFMQFSQSMENENCRRTNQGTVKDILGLTKRLFDRHTDLGENILPAELRRNGNDAEQRKKTLAIVINLLSIISHREKLNDMGDGLIVRVLKVIFESLYNETCQYLNLMFRIDCNNVENTDRVLRLLQLREQAIKSFDVLDKMTIQPTLEGDFTEEYITWHNIVKPIINTNETIGLFGSFPNYLSTCRRCSFHSTDQCPNPNA